MQGELLPRVIFSPGRLALDLAAGLADDGVEVTLFSPGAVPVAASVRNVMADLSGFERELAARGVGYLELLKQHPLTFITLARQVQSELLAQAFAAANAGEVDLVHIYTNEEELALPFAQFCVRPVVFTHHDPFNFLARYRSLLPRYARLPWISLSLAQRQGMPPNTNWVGNVYHGLDPQRFRLEAEPGEDYVAYLGRLIEPKGVHLAIAAVRAYNVLHPGRPLKLKLAGKHYAGVNKDRYWQTRIAPELADGVVEYVGFLATDEQKQAFLGRARALVVPSTFEEPFGLVMLEALACGTPVLGVASGAIPEVVRPGETGVITEPTAEALAQGLEQAVGIDRHRCRADFEQRFTLAQMAAGHAAVYERLIRE